MTIDESLEVYDSGIHLPEELSMNPETSDKKNEDPETGGATSTTNTKEKTINIQELMGELEESIDTESRRYKGCVYILWIVAVVFLLVWIVGLPVAISETEDWTYAAAWYFSIQAGFGVGYGALTVQSQGMEIFLIIHLFLGAISISFLIAYLISKMIDANDKKKKSKRTIVAEELGQPVVGYKSWIVGSILLIVVMAAGILYGMLYEQWNFSESLYFIVSTCQTSGLLAPSIQPKNSDNLFAPLFVSLLVILAVPLWAYNIGKASVELVNLDRAQRRQTSVMKRDRDAQAAFLRLAPSMGIDVSDPNHVQVTLAGFLVELLLFEKMADEATIAAVIQEFHTYVQRKEQGGDEVSTAPMWVIIARVRFLQLVQLGLLERDDWQAFLSEAEHTQDKTTILKGSTSKQQQQQQTSIDVSNKTSSETATFSSLNVAKQSDTDLSPISDMKSKASHKQNADDES